jgi:hypothetical protein
VQLTCSTECEPVRERGVQIQVVEPSTFCSTVPGILKNLDTITLEDLLRKVVVDKGGLERQVSRRVEAVDLILRRLRGRLAHRQQIWREKIARDFRPRKKCPVETLDQLFFKSVSSLELNQVCRAAIATKKNRGAVRLMRTRESSEKNVGTRETRFNQVLNRGQCCDNYFRTFSAKKLAYFLKRDPFITVI